MADDPEKVGRDRATVSSQEHEIRHLKSVMQNEFPEAGPPEIEEAIGTAMREAGQSRDRDTIERLVRKHLTK